MTVAELVLLGVCWFCKSKVFKGSNWDLREDSGESRLRCPECKEKHMAWAGKR